MINAGIDFGTSTCSIGVWKADQPALLKLEGESVRLTSALHSSRQHLAVSPFDERELRSRLDESSRGETRSAGDARVALSVDRLDSRVRGAMRREAASAEALRRGGANDPAALFADPEITFGEEAVRQHLADPHRGYFVKSPKSFLGADIKQQHIDLFAEIITRILAHIKQTAEAQVDDRIDAVCLGRPVRFHGLRGEDGNRQAVAILERAAVAAGFGQVEFLFEPIAAAMKEVETQSGVAPDVIYVTGGTAKSPMIEECIRANYRGVDIVVGDLFGSVTSGLATWAHRIFR